VQVLPSGGVTDDENRVADVALLNAETQLFGANDDPHLTVRCAAERQAIFESRVLGDDSGDLNVRLLCCKIRKWTKVELDDSEAQCRRRESSHRDGDPYNGWHPASTDRYAEQRRARCSAPRKWHR
jgi:hypothetical protein